MAKYCFPVVLTPDEGGYYAEFPDLEDCFTQGNSLMEALEMSADVLGLTLTDMEDRGVPIPAPSVMSAVHPEDQGAVVSLVMADTVEYRKRVSKSAVKKTLSIPQWLDTAAEAAGVNFSQTLQEALTAKLGLQ